MTDGDARLVYDRESLGWATHENCCGAIAREQDRRTRAALIKRVRAMPIVDLISAAIGGGEDKPNTKQLFLVYDAIIAELERGGT